MYEFIIVSILTFRYSLRWSLDWFESAGMSWPIAFASAFLLGLMCGLAVADRACSLTAWLLNRRGGVVGGIVLQNPHDNTAAEANAHKGMSGTSMALMLLVVVLAIISAALGFGPVGSWVAGWSGMPLSVSGWVWCFFVLLLYSGLNRGVRRHRL